MEHVYNFLIVVFNIEDIQKPKKIDEFSVLASSKSEACDMGHTKAEELYPQIKRMVETKSFNF
jgi:hypothetical protein